VVRVAAQSFRANPDLDTVTVITEMGVGEALVSTLQDKGIPAPVQRVLVRPPYSRMGKATDEERQALRAADPNMKRYANAYDPRSAFEVLNERIAASQKQQQQAAQEKQEQENQERAARQKQSSKPKARSSNRQSTTEAFFKSMARSLGSAVGGTAGRKFLRGVLGSLLK